MAVDSSLCGPSTPLQDFGKHTSVDRSLQKDRLFQQPAAANGPSNRPARMQGSNALSAEFTDFAGAEPAGLHATDAPMLDFPHTQLKHEGAPGFYDGASSMSTHPDVIAPTPLAHHTPEPLHMASSSAPASASWVNDFRRMHVPRSATPSSPMSSSLTESPVRFQSHRAFHPANSLSIRRHPLSLGSSGSASSSPMHFFNHNQARTQKVDSSAVADDKSAFEEAFAQAREDLELHEKKEKEMRDAVRVASGKEEAAIKTAIEAEARAEAETEKTSGQHTSVSAAGELLKFFEGDHGMAQNLYGGTFFALMQQVRDGEIRVDNDKLKQIQNQLYPQSPVSAAEGKTRRNDSLPLHTNAGLSHQASSMEIDTSDLDHLHDDFTLSGYESGFGGYESNYSEGTSIGDGNTLYDGLPRTSRFSSGYESSYEPNNAEGMSIGDENTLYDGLPRENHASTSGYENSYGEHDPSYSGGFSIGDGNTLYDGLPRENYVSSSGYEPNYGEHDPSYSGGMSIGDENILYDGLPREDYTSPSGYERSYGDHEPSYSGGMSIGDENTLYDGVPRAEIPAIPAVVAAA